VQNKRVENKLNVFSRSLRRHTKLNDSGEDIARADIYNQRWKNSFACVTCDCEMNNNQSKPKVANISKVWETESAVSTNLGIYYLHLYVHNIVLYTWRLVQIASLKVMVTLLCRVVIISTTTNVYTAPHL